jgi:hypothetical protein
MIAAVTIAPAGTAKVSDRRRNPGRERRGFAIRARKNEGIPIVSPSVTESCRGRNGNPQSSTPKPTESRSE